ncbi:MAG: exodeoxyribonuclease VII small subunit [Armatimonadetes bacterium]|nr:exodeoxyribonuclease VII small subunit [Armatimonadota bacterium]
MGDKPQESADQPPAEELDFETALTRLEQIVEELESGKLGLEESLRKFGEAMQLSALCEKKLKEAEAKVEEYIASARQIAGEADDTEDEAATEDLFEDI